MDSVGHEPEKAPKKAASDGPAEPARKKVVWPRDLAGASKEIIDVDPQAAVVAGTRRLETGWAADEQSIFQIASISKTVTGVCAMRLVERGLLALDDDIAPLTERVGFSVRNPRHPTAAITLRMLLSHTSSITDSAVYSNSYTAGDSQWSLARFCREYFAPDGCFFSATANYGEAEPGASFAYSNVGAGLVGFLVEAASGQPFADFAEENVLGPLGMTSCADHPCSWSARP